MQCTHNMQNWKYMSVDILLQSIKHLIIIFMWNEINKYKILYSFVLEKSLRKIKAQVNITTYSQLAQCDIILQKCIWMRLSVTYACTFHILCIANILINYAFQVFIFNICLEDLLVELDIMLNVILNFHP